ncbi:MAG: DUF4832 domain-containing protein [Clostridia bacterium]|nr:DUF4832 domain-containing protein [Clostridia bacterium]
MMKRAKWLLAFVLILCTVLSVPGCQPDPSTQEQTTDQQEQQSTQPEETTAAPEDDYVQPGALIDFTGEQVLDDCHSTVNASMGYSVADGVAFVMANGEGRSAFVLDVSDINADDYTYVALRVKVSDTLHTGKFYTAYQSRFEVNGQSLGKTLYYMGTDDWQTVVLNYKVGNGTDDEIDAYFKGNLSALMIEPWSQSQKGAIMYINSIGFYNDRKDAAAFRGVAVSADTVTEVTEMDITATLQNGSASIKLGDTRELLTNPGMGWNFAYHSNNLNIFANTLRPGDYLDAFPCDIVYFRLGWADVEKQEGVYDWSVIDDAADEWVARGKRIAVRFCAAFPGNQNTPLWVRDAGAQGAVDAKGKWFAYYDDPVFLEKLENFIAAAAEHLSKYPVEFVDVGSLGSWGEGHSLETECAPITTEMKINHMRLWKKYFPNTLVLAGDDMLRERIVYLPTGAPYNCYDKDALDYALEQGLGMFDDSVQVGMTNVSNGYRGNIEMAQLFWKNVPVSVETHPGTAPTENYLDAVNRMHASYVRLHCDPYSIMDNPYTREITLRAGYRIVPLKMQVENFISGQNATFTLTVKNRGAAPCYAGGYLMISVTDENGNVIASGRSDFNVKDLDVGETLVDTKSTDVAITLSLPALQDGLYRVYVSVVDDQGTPLYNMPVGISQGDKTYLVGILNNQS